MRILLIINILFILLLSAFVSTFAQQKEVPIEIPPLQRKADNYQQSIAIARELIRQGNPGQALTLIMQMKDTYGENTELNELLKDAYLAGKVYDKAEELIKKDIERDPKNWLFYCELANVDIKTQRMDEAKQNLDRAIDLAPDKNRAYQEVAAIYIRNSITAEAIDTYKKARMKLNQPAIFSMELAGIYESLKDYKSAVDEYFLFMGDDSSKFDLVESRINNLVQSQENLDGIQAALNERIKKKPNDKYYQKLYGDLLFRRKDLSGAFETYKKVDDLFNGKGKFILNFASMCYNQKYYENAIQASQYLLSVKPSPGLVLSARLLIARSDEGLEKFTEAVNVYQEIIDQYGNPNSAEAKLYRQEIAFCYFQIGEINLYRFRKPSDAYGFYQKVVTDYRDCDVYPPALVRLSDCLMIEGDLDSARTLLENASQDSRAESKREEIEFKLAEIEFFKGNFEDAQTGYSQLITDFPKGLYVNNSLERIVVIGDNQELDRVFLSSFAAAMREKLQGKYDSALMTLDQLINAKSEKLSDLAQLEKGKVYQEEKKYSSSVDAYQKLLDKYPKSLYRDQAQKLIGDVYNYGLKNKTSAIQAYEKFLKDFDRSMYADEVRDKLQELKAGSSTG
jgi:tetratricopeptide (TPR) repeat protein